MEKKKIYKAELDNNREYYVIALSYFEAELIIKNIIQEYFTCSIEINSIKYIAECYYENN